MVRSDHFEYIFDATGMLDRKRPSFAFDNFFDDILLACPLIWLWAISFSLAKTSLRHFLQERDTQVTLPPHAWRYLLPDASSPLASVNLHQRDDLAA